MDSVSPTREPNSLSIHIAGNLAYRSARIRPLESKTFLVPFPRWYKRFQDLFLPLFLENTPVEAESQVGTPLPVLSALCSRCCSVSCSHVQDPVLHQTKRLQDIFLPGEFSGDFHARFICGGFFILFHKYAVIPIYSKLWFNSNCASVLMPHVYVFTLIFRPCITAFP